MTATPKRLARRSFPSRPPRRDWPAVFCIARDVLCDRLNHRLAHYRFGGNNIAGQRLQTKDEQRGGEGKSYEEALIDSALTGDGFGVNAAVEVAGARRRLRKPRGRQ